MNHRRPSREMPPGPRAKEGRLFSQANIVWPSGLSLNNLKLHKTKAVKSICIQET